MQNDWKKFISWEATAWDTVDLKLTYIDMVGGDFHAAVLLAQLVYWHLPGRKGETKLRVQRDGHFWLVKSATEIWEETRLTRRQSDKAIAKLKGLGLIIVEVHKWAAKGKTPVPTRHIAIDGKKFMALWAKASTSK